MTTYILQRLLSAIPTVFLLSVAVFTAVRLLPGDSVADAMAESGFAASPEQVNLMKKDLGLDRPAVAQYLTWVADIARGDFGRSFVNRRAVSDSLRQSIPVTAELGVLAIVISLSIAIPLGTLSALLRNSPADLLLRLFAVVGITVPSFVIAMLSLLLGLRWFGWVPPTSYHTLIDDPAQNLTQLLLPSLILGYALAASVMRMTRSTVLEALNEDYVRTARAKGLRGHSVVISHVLRNALIPVVTIIGLQVTVVVGGSVVIESIFNLPGLGQTLLVAVTRRDYPVIQAVILILGTAVVLTNLLVDLSYCALDPRIRYR